MDQWLKKFPKKQVVEKKTVEKSDTTEINTENNETCVQVHKYPSTSRQPNDLNTYEGDEINTQLEQSSYETTEKMAGKSSIKNTKAKNIYKFSKSWLEKPEFKDWLAERPFSVQQKNAQAYCKLCQCNIYAHKATLLRHANSDRHKQQSRQAATNKKIPEVFESTPLANNVKNAELKLCGFLTTNNLSFNLMDTLCPLLKNIFVDSEIAKNLSVKRTKATAIVVESLGKTFLDNLYNKLKEPGCFFSLIMDETTDISIKKQCAITVIYFDNKNQKIVTDFFDIIETEGNTAVDLYETLNNSMLSKNIPLENFVGFSSDTTNVMVGKYHSVFSLLKEENPALVCVKCSCHMAHLAVSKACLKLPRSVEDLLRNVGSHFNRSASRRKQFEQFQVFFKVEIHKILSPSITRWLSIKKCVDRVLEQYDPLAAYLRQQVFEDPSITTEQMLATMDNKFTILYLEFMSYTLGLMTDFNLLFQTEKPLLHRVKPETEKLLKILCCNYLDISAVKNKNIFHIDHENPRNFVPMEKMYIGISATESLNKLKENPVIDKKDFDIFFKSILAFYIELVTNIKQRFSFEDPIFDYLSIVDPIFAQSFQIKSLKHIVDRFPVLNQHILNIQTLDNEWREHALLDHKNVNSNVNTSEPEEYWKHIFQMKNVAGVGIFPNLQKVLSLLLVLPFSNASVERIFSNVFNIKTDKRNLLNTSTLRATLASKNGIQNEGGCVQFKPCDKMLKAKIWDNK